MEELELQEKPGLFSRLTNLFGQREEVDEMDADIPSTVAGNAYQLKAAYRYHVTVRQHITNFEEAYSAANGLKRGEQQIVNLANTEPVLRQKIVDFMSGVAFAQDANWEQIGEHIYLVAPASAFVEVASATPKTGLFRN
ncbi:MAG: cell division protein SepF [Fimbriimonadaceae bacterium]|nr:cell division protein SepF [Fimbriimonadaceae bacterium]